MVPKSAALFLIFLPAFCFSQKIPLVHSGQAIERGKILYDSGKHADAIKEFNTVPERDTNYVFMLTEAALAYVAAEKYDDVLALCEKGMAAPSPYVPNFLRYQAIAEDKKGNFEKSVKLFRDAIRKYPADYGLLYNLGVTYYNNKQYEQAAQVFFDVLSINPFHSGSHLNLGRIAIGQGRKVHGMFSFGIYLSINETDNARLVLLNNFLDNQVTDEGSVPPFGLNAPEKLDQIIRAKIAMDKQFKSEFPVDAAVVKQFEMFFQQLETIPEDSSDPWVKAYLPMYRFIRDEHLIEPFVYHILSSATNKDVKKWLSKNDKRLKSFYESANTIIKKQREAISIEGFGYPQPVEAWYDGDNNITALGELTAADIRQGHWKFYYNNYELSAEGDYNNQGIKIGVWKYYRNDGTVKSIEDYSTGEVTVYHRDGATAEHFYLKDGKIHGEVELYFPCGVLKERLTYQDGKRHGKGQTFHASGGVDMAYQYLDNKAVGEFKVFYANGNLQTQANYTDNERDGGFRSYFANKQLESEGQYRRGVVVGTWTHYYSNGQVARKGNYNAEGSPIGEWVYFDEQGMLTEKRVFDDKGNLEGANTHYFNNRIHFVNTYKKDVLAQVVFYDRDGEEIAKYGNANGTFAVRNYFVTGQLQSEGGYKRGELHGVWRYYNRYGKLISEYNYEDGLLQGKGVEYYASGAKKYLLQYKDNELQGYFQEFYQHGPVKQEGWFDNGNREQRWLTYFSDGTLESDNYYLRNSLTGEQLSYAPDGKLSNASVYKADNRLTDLKSYDSKGNVITVQRADDHIQVFEDRLPNKQLRAKLQLLCGNYVNELTRWYPDGSVYSVYNFENGKKYGPYIHYDVYESPVMEGTYLEDEEEGLWKFYNDGKLSYQGRYVNGLRDSTWTFYYAFGKVSSYSHFKKGELEGVSRYFSPDGEPLVEKMYVGGDLIAWRDIKDGEEGATWQNFSGTGTLSVKNSAGKIVYEETYQDGLREGLKGLYFNNGKPCEEFQYSKGDLDGPYAEYHPNGKLLEKGTFKNDALEGAVEFFYSDGTPRKVEYFRMGTRHGKAIYYKGKSRKEYTFWNGVPE